MGEGKGQRRKIRTKGANVTFALREDIIAKNAIFVMMSSLTSTYV